MNKKTLQFISAIVIANLAAFLLYEGYYFFKSPDTELSQTVTPKLTESAKKDTVVISKLSSDNDDHENQAQLDEVKAKLDRLEKDNKALKREIKNQQKPKDEPKRIEEKKDDKPLIKDTAKATVVKPEKTIAKDEVPKTIEKATKPAETIQEQQKEKSNSNAAKEFVKYKVKKHDTLYSIAQQFNVTIEWLKAHNNLKETTQDGKKEYVVKKGDVLIVGEKDK